MASRAHLVILLHMHQPLYVDPATGRAELPWVRLHGARAYYDVAWLLDQYPHVHLTVNFVPSLLAQLEQVAAGGRDAWLELALRPPGSLEPAEREKLLASFFSLNWSRSIETRPRYRELLDKRGRAPRAGELAERAASFSAAELRDLTVLFYLSWLGFAARVDQPELAALEQKGRDYSDADLALVIQRQEACCHQVIDLYRRLAERGQVELSSSPFYHPIVPLLVDTQTAERAQPRLPLPERFAFPEDAAAQIALGKAAHTRLFAAPPVGMWPPEGSVSPEAASAYAAAGIKWLCTYEGNLWRSLELGGQLQGVGRGALYRAYSHRGVDFVFRDRDLSDRVGFSYAHGDSVAGAHDLLARARDAAHLADSVDLGAAGPALVPVVLDGENPWEAYPGSGEPFLRALFEGLRDDPVLSARSVGEHLAEAPPRIELSRLHSGSWIDSDFHIWIGDPVKNRAWEQLGRARRRLARARLGEVDAARLERAREHMLAAEGSDWFWWFGEPFHSTEDHIFDRLFRAHVAAVWRELGDEPPGDLAQPIAEARPAPAVRPPSALISPRLRDGRPGFYDWHGAGVFEVGRGAAMAETPLIERVWFGFDLSTLYLRLDPTPAMGADLRQRVVVEAELSTGERLVRVHGRGSSWHAEVATADGWRSAGRADTMVTGAVLAMAVPFTALSLQARDRVALTLRLLDGVQVIGRYPSDVPLAFSVPDERFAAENWSV